MWVFRILLIALSGILWRLGGQGGFPFAKSLRRWGVPIIICLSYGITYRLCLIPLFAGVFSVGYGINSRLSRIIPNQYLRRGFCGLLYCLPAIALLWGNWWLMGFDFLITIIGVCLAGNQKFKYNDEREESFIGLIIAICKVGG